MDMPSPTPQSVRCLEDFEEAIALALDGSPQALERVRALWPQVQLEAEPAEVDQSRFGCLQGAIEVWDRVLRSVAHPERAIWALDVLCVLFEELEQAEIADPCQILVESETGETLLALEQSTYSISR